MPASNDPAIGGYSPVSYFEAHAAERGKPEFQAEYEGNQYLFTSADQKARFEANPRKYVPAFGGTCAFGQAIGKEFPVDPTSFKIVDGQLLVFLNNAEVDAKALWEKEGDSACVLKAKSHFEKTKQG